MSRRAAALLLLAALPLWAAAQGFSFALIGDLPYSDFERRHLPRMLEEIARTDASFVIHAGDIKNGYTPCSDELLWDRLVLFRAAPLPLVLVPGDNEWSDCHRPSNGGYAPLERLQVLRRLFFAGEHTLGRRPFRLERQSSDRRFAEFRENVRWVWGPVLFASLNMPGGDNNRGKGRRPSGEFVRRNQANLAWLAAAFDHARRQRLAGVVIIIQANPEFESANAGHPARGYRDFLERLRAETLAFAGQVVLVHGDTHNHRIDKPLLDPKTRRPVVNFTRVETFGSPVMGWVKAEVDPAYPSLFRFEARVYAPQPISVK